MDRERVVGAYWEHHRLAHSSVRAERLSADDSQWAWDLVEDAALDGTDGVIDLLEALAWFDLHLDPEATARLRRFGAPL